MCNQPDTLPLLCHVQLLYEVATELQLLLQRLRIPRCDVMPSSFLQQRNSGVMIDMSTLQVSF
jgi:hypothetical protein